MLLSNGIFTCGYLARTLFSFQFLFVSCGKYIDSFYAEVITSHLHSSKYGYDIVSFFWYPAISLTQHLLQVASVVGIVRFCCILCSSSGTSKLFHSKQHRMRVQLAKSTKGVNECTNNSVMSVLTSTRSVSVAVTRMCVSSVRGQTQKARKTNKYQISRLPSQQNKTAW